MSVPLSQLKWETTKTILVGSTYALWKTTDSLALTCRRAAKPEQCLLWCLPLVQNSKSCPKAILLQSRAAKTFSPDDTAALKLLIYGRKSMPGKESFLKNCKSKDALLPQSCGDGQVTGGEACDPPGPGCSDDCMSILDGWLCSGSCKPLCSDGMRVGDEKDDGRCDDQNFESHDGCDTGCKVERGWVCEQGWLGVEGLPCKPICGDGLVVGSETCDDNNTSPNDGCSSVCQNEAKDAWLCPGYTGQANQVAVEGGQCTCKVDQLWRDVGGVPHYKVVAHLKALGSCTGPPALKDQDVTGASECGVLCSKNDRCNFFVYREKSCRLLASCNEYAELNTKPLNAYLLFRRMDEMVNCDGKHVGQSCPIICASGAVQATQMQLTCSKTGQWAKSISKPLTDTCKPEACHLLPVVTGIDVSECKGRKTAESCVARCAPGFSPAQNSPGQVFRVCQASGTFDGENPTCAADACSGLQEMTQCTAFNAECQYNVQQCLGKKTGQSCQILCNQGWTQKKGGSLQCTTQGKFSGSLPTCEANTCRVPAAVEGVDFSKCARIKTLEQCSVECSPGYDTNNDLRDGKGKISHRCEPRNAWSGKVPQCKKMTCTQPSYDSSSQDVSDCFNKKLHMSCTVKCKAGYHSPGKSTAQSTSVRTCSVNTQNGGVKFSGANPRCDQYTCRKNGGSDCKECRQVSARSADNQCISCNPGYYHSGTICVPYPCSTGAGKACAQCKAQASRTSSHQCMSCNKGYKLINQKCHACESGRYQITANYRGNSCQACPANCGNGKYRAGCGGASQGSCQPCTGNPAHSVWTSGGGFANKCSWGCQWSGSNWNDRWIRNGNSCRQACWVTIYEHPSFGGRERNYMETSSGRTGEYNVDSDMNDRMSAFKVHGPSSCRFRWYEHSNFGGFSCGEFVGGHQGDQGCGRRRGSRRRRDRADQLSSLKIWNR
eukprot:gnl/MRDRNA2_/MRDRNA2_144731_c0_seq1.p1 gnl/MRDRNA2_/MRDRNA2_144731_c0~~gnl/MRDRNA2_/MRDRNA2_144731_c0_seq1.p1  ORF type:complete len:1088 (+),score=120.29 gnl/MRDRNA2_/MRDRNA2_144731_c0_seq1:430-3264(+)